MPNLKDLPDDINKLLYSVGNGTSEAISDEDIDKLSKAIAEKVRLSLKAREERVRPPKTLYMSELGAKCHRKLWYEHHQDRLEIAKEKTVPSNMIRFLYGDVLEEIVLFLAEQAGHTVSLQQERVEAQSASGWKATGRIDAVIDGTLVDVKTASQYAFKKFQEGLKESNDSFGYLGQIRGYAGAMRRNGPTLPDRDNVAFLAIDKSSGEIALDMHKTGPAAGDATKAINAIGTMLESELPPARAYSLVAHTHGLKLGMECVYCPFKHECWKDANDGEGLRTFVYATGPIYLGEVHGQGPRVTEITKEIKAAQKGEVINA